MFHRGVSDVYAEPSAVSASQVRKRVRENAFGTEDPFGRMNTGASACFADELASWVYDGAEEAVVIDVRTPEEFAAGHIVDAINRPATAPVS